MEEVMSTQELLFASDKRESRAAQLSECGTWRYSLHRQWDPTKLTCAWVCLNPSTADAETDDPTVRKIRGFSKRWGYGGFALFNLLAFRATDPKELLRAFNPHGPANDPAWIAKECTRLSPDPAIIAWGNIHRRFHRNALEVVRALQIARCLGYTHSGEPLHPLMLPYSTKLQTTDPSRWIHRLC
jgi:hypothetical protein